MLFDAPVTAHNSDHDTVGSYQPTRMLGKIANSHSTIKRYVKCNISVLASVLMINILVQLAVLAKHTPGNIKIFCNH